MAQPPAGRACTICDGSHQLNTQLCGDCQSWNDFTHLISCEWHKHAQLDGVIFSAVSGTKRAERSRRFGHFPKTIKDLPYQDFELFRSRPQCIVCRAVGELLQEFLANNSCNTQGLRFGAWQPFVARVDSTCKQQPGDADRALAGYSTELCLLPGAIATQENGAVSYIPVVLKLVLRYRENGYDLSSVRRWIPQPLSLANLARWLDNCREHHGPQCNALVNTRFETVPSGFRLIDISTNSILECAERVDYVALSYCWPSTAATAQANLQLQLHNVKQLSQPNGLDISSLAPVIADAIQLCKDMGKRYLWIDQLCIIQDDPASKFSQILAMDRIYNMADVTIVALSSNPGLPGVSSRPRDTTFNAVYGLWDGGFNAGHAEATPPFTNWAIARSRWDTRGWTFQERKLSRRLVFVDDLRAYFSCFQGSFWEHDPQAFDTKYEPAGSYNAVETGLRTTKTFAAYAKLATLYSKRQLSFRSDILNAFAGVGSILAFNLETSLLYGLPERYLLRSLLWRSDDYAQGRDESLGLPSWSWAAWDGSVDYGFTEFQEQRAPVDGYAMDAFKPWHIPEVGSLVTFFYSDHSAVVRRVDEGRWWFTNKEMDNGEFAALQESLRDDPYNRTADVHQAMLAYTWDLCCHNPVEARRHADITDEARAKAAATPGCLAFTTTCALLTLRQAAHNAASPMAPAVYFDMYSTATDGRPARFVGQTMLMERKWAERMLDLRRSYCVVVLGAGDASSVVDNRRPRPVWESLTSGSGITTGLYVMVTEQRDGVLYRLAVGVADLMAWTSAGATWQSVVLA